MKATVVILCVLCLVYAQARPFPPAHVNDVEVTSAVGHRILLHVVEAAKPAAAAEHTILARRLHGAYAWSEPNGMIDHGKSISTETSDTVNQQAAEDAVSGAVDTINANPAQPRWSRPQLALGKKIGDASAVADQSTAEQQIQSLQSGRKLKQAPTPAWSDAYSEAVHAQDSASDTVGMAGADTVEDQSSAAADSNVVSYKPLESHRSGRRALRGAAWSDPNAEMDHGKSISVDTSDTVDQENVEDQIDAAESAEAGAGVQQVDKASGIPNDDYNN